MHSTAYRLLVGWRRRSMSCWRPAFCCYSKGTIKQVCKVTVPTACLAAPAYADCSSYQQPDRSCRRLQQGAVPRALAYQGKGGFAVLLAERLTCCWPSLSHDPATGAPDFLSLAHSIGESDRGSQEGALTDKVQRECWPVRQPSA